MSPIPKDFARRADEPPAAWLERLLLAGVGDLTGEQRRDLAASIRAATQAAGVVELPPSVRPPEATADSLLDVHQAEAGGPYFLRLKGAEMVLLGPYASSDLAYQDAGKVRAFLAEVIREGRREGAAPS